MERSFFANIFFCPKYFSVSYLLREVGGPVLVAVLLELRPDLDRVVGVGLGEGLGGVQPQVDVAGLGDPADDGDGALEAPLQQLRRERLLLRLHVNTET